MSMYAVTTSVSEVCESTVCYNCYRTKDDLYVNLSQVARDEKLRKALKFCNLKDKTVDLTQNKERNYNPIYLCTECKRYLTDKASGNQYCFYWPALCWKMLSSERIIGDYSFVKFVWQMFPQKWRTWWFPEVQKLEGRQGTSVGGYHGARGRGRRAVLLYEGMEVLQPPSFFEDVTEKYFESRDIEKNLRIEDLLSYWDSTCVWPYVKCPWGCTEFLSECGTVSFDDVYHHFCDGFVWSFHDLGRPYVQGNKKDKLYGARPDFLLEVGSVLPGGQESLIVKHCIIIDQKKGPCVLTCSNHDGGSTEMYIHPPVNPATHQFPSLYTDQLAPAVFMPRLIRNFQKHGFSNSYQVHQIHSGYSGIDTCNIQEVGTFDKTSGLMYKNEGLIIAQREDLKNHLHLLHERNITNDSAFEEIMKSSIPWEDETDSNLSKALEGSTMMTFMDAIKLQDVLSSPHVCSDNSLAVITHEEESCTGVEETNSDFLEISHDESINDTNFPTFDQTYTQMIEPNIALVDADALSLRSNSSCRNSQCSSLSSRVEQDDNDDDEQQSFNYPFKPIWPEALFLVHPYSNHGASPLYSKIWCGHWVMTVCWRMQ